MDNKNQITWWRILKEALWSNVVPLLAIFILICVATFWSFFTHYLLPYFMHLSKPPKVPLGPFPPLFFARVVVCFALSLFIDIIFVLLKKLKEITDNMTTISDIYNKTYYYISNTSDYIMHLGEVIRQLNEVAKEKSSYSNIISQITKEFSRQGGGIVIGANSQKYLDYLSQLLRTTQKSFFATLRGGKDIPQYILGWFYLEKPEGFKSYDKLKYLDEVNNLNIDPSKKVRLIILTEDEMIEFMCDDIRNDFFDRNSNVTVLQVNPKDLIDRYNSKYNEYINSSYIYDDFAIFDKKILLKHNGVNTLYIGTSQQITTLQKLFDLVCEEFNNKEGIFKKLTKKKIKDKSWDQWKEYMKAQRHWKIVSFNINLTDSDERKLKNLLNKDAKRGIYYYEFNSKKMFVVIYNRNNNEDNKIQYYVNTIKNEISSLSKQIDI